MHLVWLLDPLGTDLAVVFHHLLHHHHLHIHPTVSRLSINSHLQAISATPPTYHTSLERGQRLGSSGDVKDNDKDTHKDKFGEKDKDIHEESLPVFKSLGTLSNEYLKRQTLSWHYI